MVQGNFANGDYFIDTPGISLNAQRAIFGVWINICVATIGICIRFIFCSQVGKHITSGKGGVSLWRVSPAVTPSEAFELQGILARALTKGDFAFVFASAFCVVAAVVSSASTVISNRAIGNNTVVRDVVVQGRLVTNNFTFESDGAQVRISERAKALNHANAPLDELFDFVPRDDSKWIYKPNQWNNTWKGSCSFAKHEAVELEVFPTVPNQYQTAVPRLGNYIPFWATVEPLKQGVAYSGFYSYEDSQNSTGAWRDKVTTYVFGSAPLNEHGPVQSMNISIANYLAHNIGKYDQGLGLSTFMQTNFSSDVHTVECQFVNGVDGGIVDQASANSGAYADAARNIARVSLPLARVH
jgi:hypothetical protein